jgi:hypothetical protein
MASIITPEHITALAPLEAFEGIGGVPVVINHASFETGTEVAAIINHEAAPKAFTATSDGRHVDDGGWHFGEPDGDAVYFERYELDGWRYVRVSHGWVDATSRRIVQIG